MDSKLNKVASTLFTILILAGTVASASAALAQEIKTGTTSHALELASPDKRIVLKIEVKNRLAYSVQFQGKPLLPESVLPVAVALSRLSFSYL